MMMKRYIVLFLLLTSVFLLSGQPVADTAAKLIKLEAERLPDLNIPRASHTVFYANGELTVVGGHTKGFVMTPTAEYYSDGVWHLMPTVYYHDDGMAVVLDEGQRVLIAGGHEKNLGIGQSYEAEMYYPASHTFDGFACPDRKRALAQGVELDSGHVLITGNHQGNDAFEMFDGKKSFQLIKDITNWRSAPYVFPISNEDVIVFGTVWRNQHFAPCDTVNRLKGEPFCAPLLKEWMPMIYDQNSHAEAAFIGDKSTDEYSYIVAAKNSNEEMTFIHIHDTAFSLLPTTCPIPMMTQWGRIRYNRTAVVDRNVHRVYLVGDDTTGRAYVVAVEYDKQPAPLTLYYTDPLTDFGLTTPVLTPDGDLVVTGGYDDDNFAPFASVWLLRIGERKNATISDTYTSKAWLWVVCCLFIIAAIVLTGRAVKRRKQPTQTVVAQQNETESTPMEQTDNTSAELMSRITQLMETQHSYLSPELKITDVADALAIHSKTVSACINAQGYTFNQLVNSYRLQHAKKLLCQSPDMKMSSISLESGFANERTFFRVFKDATGMTPKEWAAQQID